MQLYPVNLNLAGRCCVVVGGGSVAWRKVCGLHGAGAQVRLVSPTLVPELVELVEQGAVQWHQRAFQTEDLHGALLVFAATDSPAVQEQIRRQAESLGILVSLADQPGLSDFHVPGHFRRGDILVSVSTGGKSPALAAELRRQLERQLRPEYALAASFLGLLRTRVLALDNDARAHGRLFTELVACGIVERIAAGQWDMVCSLLSERLPVEIDAHSLVENFLEAYVRCAP